MSNKRFWCRLDWHKWVDVKTQRTKHIYFGFAGCELPGFRVIQKCKHCDETRPMSLNLSMPAKYLYQEEIWVEE